MSTKCIEISDALIKIQYHYCQLSSTFLYIAVTWTVSFETRHRNQLLTYQRWQRPESRADGRGSRRRSLTWKRPSSRLIRWSVQPSVARNNRIYSNNKRRSLLTPPHNVTSTQSKLRRPLIRHILLYQPSLNGS